MSAANVGKQAAMSRHHGSGIKKSHVRKQAPNVRKQAPNVRKQLCQETGPEHQETGPERHWCSCRLAMDAAAEPSAKEPPC